MGALILGIIIVVCICAVVDYPRIKEREEREAMNLTNYEVQKQVLDQMNKELRVYLKAPTPPWCRNPVDYLLHMCDVFGVPRPGYDLTPEKRQKEYDWWQDSLRYNSGYKWKDDVWGGTLLRNRKEQLKYDIISGEINDHLRSQGIEFDEKNLTNNQKRQAWDLYLKCAPDIRTDPIYLEGDLQKHLYSKYDVVPFPYEELPPELHPNNLNLEDIIYPCPYAGSNTESAYTGNLACASILRHLKRCVMKKRMRERGYKADPTWGEKKRRQKIYEENQKKYPWMYK